MSIICRFSITKMLVVKIALLHINNLKARAVSSLSAKAYSQLVPMSITKYDYGTVCIIMAWCYIYSNTTPFWEIVLYFLFRNRTLISCNPFVHECFHNSNHPAAGGHIYSFIIDFIRKYIKIQIAHVLNRVIVCPGE